MSKQRKQPTKLTDVQIVQMAKEWGIKTMTEFSKEFDVSPTTISKAANALNKLSDGAYCKPISSAKATILRALATLNKEEATENVV